MQWIIAELRITCLACDVTDGRRGSDEHSAEARPGISQRRTQEFHNEELWLGLGRGTAVCTVYMVWQHYPGNFFES